MRCDNRQFAPRFGICHAAAGEWLRFSRLTQAVGLRLVCGVFG
ncbi:hypothetical protein [Neisseria musculi]|nr:hypothetical protein [Neisseria musculi]